MKRLLRTVKIVATRTRELKGMVYLSALRIANQHIDERAALMTSRDLVSNAESHLLRTNTVKGLTVVSVQESSREDVYCLTVDGHGAFALSNGVIVSNCDAFGYFVTYEHGIEKKLSRPTMSMF